MNKREVKEVKSSENEDTKVLSGPFVFCKK